MTTANISRNDEISLVLVLWIFLAISNTDFFENFKYSASASSNKITNTIYHAFAIFNKCEMLLYNGF